MPRVGRLSGIAARLARLHRRGHATDRAVILGLPARSRTTLDPDPIEGRAGRGPGAQGRSRPRASAPAASIPARDLVFDYGPPLPGHANGMILPALDDDGDCSCTETYYSIGGGFVVSEAELSGQAAPRRRPRRRQRQFGYPYPFATAAEMLAMGRSEPA